ncbi:MAG TPA: hypothetical protein VHV28_04775 [Solirubrobacteraceae bacterium]|nr:hypothetical protein [Solirubrobacteraceae bacterium]
MRRLLLVPVLALAVSAALAAPAGAGDQRASVHGGVSVVLPAGWHLVRGRLSEVVDPIPRLAAATFPAHLSAHECECGFPHVLHFPRTGAFVFVWEYPVLGPRDLKTFPKHEAHFHIGRSAIKASTCAGAGDGRVFREAGRGYQVEIYLGPDAPATARAQIAAILDSWRVTPT